MTPKQAGKSMSHARLLLRLGMLTRNAFVVFDYLMWSSGRVPFSNLVETPYVSIAAGTRLRSEEISKAVKLLADVGLLIKHRQRMLVDWVRGKKSMVLPNRYEILLEPEGHCDSGLRRGTREDKTLSKQEAHQRVKLQALRRRFEPRGPERSVAEQIAALARG